MKRKMRTLIKQTFILFFISVGCCIVFKSISGSPIPLVGNFDPTELKAKYEPRDHHGEEDFRKIDGAAVNNLIENDMAVIIDVRNLSDYLKGHIPASIDIEFLTQSGKTENLKESVKNGKILVIYGANEEDKNVETFALNLREIDSRSIFIYKKGFSDWIVREYITENN